VQASQHDERGIVTGVGTSTEWGMAGHSWTYSPEKQSTANPSNAGTERARPRPSPTFMSISFYCKNSEFPRTGQANLPLETGTLAARPPRAAPCGTAHGRRCDNRRCEGVSKRQNRRAMTRSGCRPHGEQPTAAQPGHRPHRLGQCGVQGEDAVSDGLSEGRRWIRPEACAVLAQRCSSLVHCVSRLSLAARTVQMPRSASGCTVKPSTKRGEPHLVHERSFHEWLTCPSRTPVSSHITTPRHCGAARFEFPQRRGLAMTRSHSASPIQHLVAEPLAAACTAGTPSLLLLRPTASPVVSVARTITRRRH
jgi:hypothetical protein